MSVDARIYIMNVCRSENSSPIPVEIARVEIGRYDAETMYSMDNMVDIDYEINTRGGEYSDTNPYGGKIERFFDLDELRDDIELSTPPCSRWKMVSRILDCIPSFELENIEVVLYLY